MKIKIKSFWLAGIALAGATILFCLPGQEFPEEDWFSKIFLDKWIHVGLFAGLVALWCLPFISRITDRTKLKKMFVVVTVAFILYGIAIEFVQGNFIENRTFGIDDMIADSIGAGIGLLFAGYQRRIQNPEY